MIAEAWRTDADLGVAFRRFVDRIPGFQLPVAFGVARDDGGVLTFGHVNRLGAVRPLPAVVLARVCGYVNKTEVAPIDRQRLSKAVELLAPAEAATHMPHPNLWSWRQLLVDASMDATFIACFLAAESDPIVDERDRVFRGLIDS